MFDWLSDAWNSVTGAVSDGYDYVTGGGTPDPDDIGNLGKDVPDVVGDAAKVETPWYQTPLGLMAIQTGVGGIRSGIGAIASGNAEEDAAKQNALGYQQKLDLMALQHKYNMELQGLKGKGGGGGGGARVPDRPELVTTAYGNAAAIAQKSGEGAAEAWDRLSARLQAAALSRRGGS